MKTCQFYDGEPCINLVEGRTDYCSTHNRLMRKAEETAKRDAEKLAKKLTSVKPKRVPVRKVSEKQKVKNMEYSERVKVWKVENPKCKANIENLCVGYTQDCHHQKKRGELLMVEKYWIPVCRPCHDWIRDNSDEARKRGLTINYLEPEFVEPHKI